MLDKMLRHLDFNVFKALLLFPKEFKHRRDLFSSPL